MEKQIQQPKATVGFFKRIKRLCLLVAWLFAQLRIFGKNFEKDPNPGKIIKQKEAALSILQALDINIDIHGQENLSHDNHLVVANHASWLDIFALLAIQPMSFIAKQEISKWPLIGRIVTNGGSVYINRNNRKDSSTINQIITGKLQENVTVAFFPEARIVDGKNLQPFKAALFQSALDSQKPTLPICITYLNQDGSICDAPIYDNSVNLFQSLWQVVSVNGLIIRLDISPPIASSAHESRFDLKEAAQTAIMQNFQQQ